MAYGKMMKGMKKGAMAYGKAGKKGMKKGAKGKKYTMGEMKKMARKMAKGMMEGMMMKKMKKKSPMRKKSKMM